METKSSTQTFYDRIADVHNLLMKLNGYENSIAKLLRSLRLNLDENSLVLDAGSGSGIVTLGFYNAGYKVRQTVAVDLSFNLLKISGEQFRENEKTDKKTTSVVQGNVLELPFADETFDLVLTCGVLEYVSIEAGLKEFARVLKTGATSILIPVKPSFGGSILEVLYKFKTHSIKETEAIAEKYFRLLEARDFAFYEPIAWSKMVFLFEKKQSAD